MTIRGRFPDARYLSFHLYEGSMPVDALADVELRPDAGANPFAFDALRASRGTYTVRVVAGARPKDPPPNTLYADSLNGEPNVSGVIIYRLYLPEGDQYGGAGLPTVTYGAGGEGDPLRPPLPSCQDPVPIASGTVNDALRGLSAPAAPSESDAPAWGISRSRPQATAVGPVSVRTGGAFFPNFHNVYLSLLAHRDQGELVAFRAKAPTYAQTRGAERMPGGQVRYWSICANDLPTTRYVACLDDSRIAVDADGYFTMVVSDVQHRPRSLRPGDNWLPAGPYPDTFVLYRQMLPDPGWAQAIERSPNAAEAPKTMGPFYPVTRICTTARFERDRCGLPVAAPASAPGARSRPSRSRHRRTRRAGRRHHSRHARCHVRVNARSRRCARHRP
jgi:hypothetical protein